MCEVDASTVCGKCQVICGEDIEGNNLDEWFQSEADRFYFYEAYDGATNSFTDLPHQARGVGSKVKVRGWGRGCVREVCACVGCV